MEFKSEAWRSRVPRPSVQLHLPSWHQHPSAPLTATPQRWLLPGRGGRAPTMAWSAGMSATRAAATEGVTLGWKPRGS